MKKKKRNYELPCQRDIVSKEGPGSQGYTVLGQKIKKGTYPMDRLVRDLSKEDGNQEEGQRGGREGA